MQPNVNCTGMPEAICFNRLTHGTGHKDNHARRMNPGQIDGSCDRMGIAAGDDAEFFL